MGCHRCGECCQKFGVVVDPQKKSFREFLEVFGIDMPLVITVYETCQHYDKETKSCTIYGDRPDYCRSFLCGKAKNPKNLRGNLK